MAKKISKKITNKSVFKIEGLLNVDSLEENVLLMDVEDIGEVCVLRTGLRDYNGKYIKITIEEASEEVPDLDL